MTLAESEAYYSAKRREKELSRRVFNRPAQITETITANTYPYKSLDPSTHEIRLLRLGDPATIGADSNYVLFHLSLDINDSLPQKDKYRYDALSYTWSDLHGDSDLTTTILVDGHNVEVTRNLAAALRMIFQHNKYMFVWADAICIDQSNINERNHQVSKMRLVYEKAERAVVWLGEEYERSGMAFEFFRSLLRHGVKDTLSESWIPWRSSKDIVNEVWAVIRLFRRDYWRRVWILQELKFAQDATFFAGSESIEWRDLKRVQKLLWDGSQIVIDMLQSTEVGHMSARLWQDGPNVVEIGHGREPEMSELRKLGATLVKYRRKDASDPRDKVFAILALCNGSAKDSIIVDYQWDTSSVLFEATIFALEQEQDLLIICENKDHNTIIQMGFTILSEENISEHEVYSATPSIYAKDDLCLPSWVPKFALPPARQRARVSEWCQSYSLPSSSAVIDDFSSAIIGSKNNELFVSAAGSTKPDISISRESRMLSIGAVRIGTITEVSSKTMPAFVADEYEFSLVYEVLREWFLTFSKYGGNELGGPGGLLDLVLLGGLYKINIGMEERKVWIKEVLTDLKIVVQHNRMLKAEEKFLRLLDDIELEEHLLYDRRHAAEVNILGVTHRCKDRSLAVLNAPEVQFAIGPEYAQVGDVVVVLLGCAVPVVLRERNEGSGGGWGIIGDAYVNGFMDGRAVNEVELGGRSKEIFDIS